MVSPYSVSYTHLDVYKRQTHGIDQQKDYLWGTAELVSWISLDGRKLEGVVDVYKRQGKESG